MTWLLVFSPVTLILAMLRFIVPVSGKINVGDIYKDLAHIWWGILFGFAIGYGSWPVGWLAVGLLAVEVIAFIARRKT